MKWLPFIWILLLFALPGQARGQQYIGKHKSEVRSLMKEHNRELYEDNSSRNTVYNMVKYMDNLGNQTLIYFFDEQDTCICSKWMCDYSMLNKVVSGLNSNYEATAEDNWYYIHEGRKYRITLTAGDWFFTITTRDGEKE